MSSGSTAFCSCTPTTCRSRLRSRTGSSPRTRTSPAVGVRSPAMHSTAVVLPAPLGPRTPRISPSSTVTSTPSTAVFPAYLLTSPSTSMTGIVPPFVAVGVSLSAPTLRRGCPAPRVPEVMTCDHDFRHVNGDRGSPRVTGMDSRSDVVGAAVLAVIVVLVGSPIAITQATGGDPTTGPWWLWWVCYALYVATFLATVWEGETHGPVWRPWVGTAGLVLTGSALYLLGGQGWTAILLVLTAAIAAHVLPHAAVLAVVAVQTLVIPLPSLPA